LQADFYMPSPAVDTVTNRPVVIVWHTGSFLPKGINGSPLGTRQDSAVVEMCSRFAKMGYVSIAASYRLGWLANSTNLDVRRGSNLAGGLLFYPRCESFSTLFELNRRDE
jgi:hypothetical protein